MRDVWDTGANETRGVPPPLPILLDYRFVVWTVVAPTRGSALRGISGWFDPTIESNRNRLAKYNYLTAYIENGGCLWIQGALPSWELWRVRDGFGTLLLPLNLPQWDDPRASHPDPDSVGVESLLYKMGAEGLGCVAGPASRSTTCRPGLRRAPRRCARPSTWCASCTSTRVGCRRPR